MFDTHGERYAYAPCIIEVSNESRYAFYCSNKDPRRIKDYIYFRKGFCRNEIWSWDDELVALGASDSGWDKQHVCDPSIVTGEFYYDWEIYKYAMFYTGSEADNLPNQIGVAFSKSLDGPWEKWSGNPLISYKPDDLWGVGQPSATCVNREGRMLLFYTHGMKRGTKMVYREIDLQDMSYPQIGLEVELTTKGLTQFDGFPDRVLNNGDVVYDSFRDGFFLVRDGHPNPASSPNFISSHLQVAFIAGGSIWNTRQDPKSNEIKCTGEWEVLGNIGQEQTGFPRNHNAGFVRNSFGCLVNRNDIEIGFAVAETDIFPDTLWTYRIHMIKGEIVKPDALPR